MDLGKHTQYQKKENPSPDDSQPYSYFSQRQKRCIAFLASFSAMFSGLSSFIYYPSITAISRSLNVSVELVSLTITSYQIVSGIAPSILGDLADQSGRRPVILLAFSVYLVANIGLATQSSYTALVVLRCLQSAGASSMSSSPSVEKDRSDRCRHHCHRIWLHCRHRFTSRKGLLCRDPSRLVSAPNIGS